MEQESPPKLTALDPVPAETLEELRELQEARFDMADTLLTLKQEEIQILAAVKKLDDRRIRLFEDILIERGLAPNTRAQIDPTTGKLVLQSPPGEVKGKRKG